MELSKVKKVPVLGEKKLSYRKDFVIKKTCSLLYFEVV